MSTYKLSQRLFNLANEYGIDQCEAEIGSDSNGGMVLYVTGFVDHIYILQKIDITNTGSDLFKQIDELCTNIELKVKEIRSKKSSQHPPPRCPTANKPNPKTYAVAVDHTPTIHYKGKTITLPNLGSPWRYTKNGSPGCLVEIRYSLGDGKTYFCELECVLATADAFNQKYYLNYAEEEDAFELHVYNLDAVNIHEHSTYYRGVDVVDLSLD